MALFRIFDQTVGQLAGLLVSTTSKGNIKGDGTEAFAQAVTQVDSGGLPFDPATAANQVLEIGELEDLNTKTDALVAAAQSTAPVNVYPLPATPVSGLTAAMTGTASTAVTGVGAAGSGKFNYITGITVSNSHATVGTDVEIQDGNGGTTFWIIPAAALYGGATLSFPTPLKQPTANTALYAKNTTTGASTRVSVNGFQA